VTGHSLIKFLFLQAKHSSEVMDISGKIVEVLPLQSGSGKNGIWKKQQFILEMESQGGFPRKVCILVWGDKIDQFDVKAGENVKVYIDVESREYNGKWYTDVKAWNLEKMGSPTVMKKNEEEWPPLTADQDPFNQVKEEQDTDDLPF
jgi:hypothetical protein